jgi:hypothetical protein
MLAMDARTTTAVLLALLLPACAGTAAGSTPPEGPPVTALLPLATPAKCSDCAGTLLWAHGYATGDQEDAVSPALDPHGGAVFTDLLPAPVDLGDGPLSGLVLGALDASGKPLYSRGFADAPLDWALTATSGSGDVFVAGAAHGAVDVGLGPTPMEGDAGLFLAKLDATGAAYWSEVFPIAAGLRAGAARLLVDPAGDAVMLVELTGSLAIGEGPLGVQETVDQDRVLRIAGGTGAVLQSTPISVDGVPVSGDVLDLALDPAGAVLAIVQDGDTPALVKLDDQGASVWSRHFDVTPSGLGVDGAGAIFLGGMGPGVYPTGAPWIVAKLDPSGAPLWVRELGDQNGQILTPELVVGAAGEVVTTLGAFGPEPADGRFPLLRKLSADGELRWEVDSLDPGGSSGVQIAVDGDGNVLFASDFGEKTDLLGPALPSLEGAGGGFVLAKVAK